MTNTVVIAGGGPAGLMLACELGLAGVRAIVLEHSTERATDSCGMVLHARSVELLRQRGIADRLCDADTPAWPRIHFGLLWLELGQLAKTEYNLLVPQWRTEQVLEARARELGAEIRRGREVVDVEQDGSAVRVTARSAEGEERIEGAYLVGCDGVRSAVARLAGFTFTELAPSYYGVIADVAIGPADGDPFEAGNFSVGQFGVLPIKPGEVRLMTVEYVREPAGDDVPVTVEELGESIRRITGTTPQLAQPRWIARFGHPTRLADSYRVGRVFLAGDAAHAHFPSAGHGLNTTLHDSVNLGWKLAASVHGWAPPPLLDTYHAERYPVGRRACVSGQAQVALQYPIERAAPLRELFAELVKFDEVNRYLIQRVTHVRYPMPAVAHPLSGQRFPDAVITTPSGERRVSDLLHSGHGVLLNLSDEYPPDLCAWADRVDVVTAAPTSEIDAGTLLIRPDGHIAWAGQLGGDNEGLRMALKAWFG